MKILSILNLVFAAASLLLCLLLLSTTGQVSTLQRDMQEKNLEIQKSSQVRQITGQAATNIVKDMARLSVENQNLRQLLAKHGFNVQVR
jgi:hypothetical protein